MRAGPEGARRLARPPSNRWQDQGETRSVAGTLRLFKPFRLCRLDDEGTPHTVRRYHLHVTLFADGQRRRSTAHVGAFVVEWEPVRPMMVRPLSSVRVTNHRFAYDEDESERAENDVDGADWLIVTAGTDTPETATCTTFNACDPTSTADSLE